MTRFSKPLCFFVDMDDTLYPEFAYVREGYRAVSQLEITDSERDAMFARLIYQHQKYGRFRIFNRVAADLGRNSDWMQEAVNVYRSNQPVLRFYKGARHALRRLRALAPVIVVTDGAANMQRNKVEGLGLRPLVDFVIYTDDTGQPKPSTGAFELAANRLRISVTDGVIIGDDPYLDVAAAAALNVPCLRVLTGRFRGIAREDSSSVIAIRSVRDAPDLFADL